LHGGRGFVVAELRRYMLRDFYGHGGAFVSQRARPF
jgi:hypothetical protein